MDRKIHLPLIIEQDEDGVYVVSCNSFKGCHAQGKTIDEALSRIKEVIQMCIEEDAEQIKNINQFVGFHDLEIAV